MQRGLILLFATILVFVGVQGTGHLSFATGREVSITRDKCGVSKVCVETPANCNPADKTCLFTSISPSVTKNLDLHIELSGSSPGYIAMGLNQSEGTAMMFICAPKTPITSTDPLFFQTMDRNNTNDALTLAERNVTEIRGRVNDSWIQCAFTVPNVTTIKVRSVTVLLGWGNLTGSTVEKFNMNVTKDSLNINIAPESRASCALEPHAVLLLLSVLTLTVLKTD